ncbi:lysophospholipid acyltransferase family protein [Lewinella sp. 4G2]|uniref:lysophospholipid acyltransferase family protein n=1 Tax=Lewinella sp. 4G2 TaxID=1803372 RepID=UPI0007B46E12|nr:lysophospholipid acyltransferase family protein [Lewinella sp. 4G2]OAV42627.1 hypothetical protein A3850_015385 [Lewinella sp. 4G2]
MAKVLYYCLLLPLSYLPMAVLYGISSGLYWLSFRLVGYRVAIVRDNIQRSFPDWGEERVDEQVEKFYRYFFDTLAESIKLFSMSEAEAVARCNVSNPELLDPLVNAGKSIIAVGAHYSNWEIAGISFPAIFPRLQVMAVYSPLKNDAADQIARANRQRNGTRLVSRRVIKAYFERPRQQPALEFFVADQSPSNVIWQKIHWTTFLNQPTGFLAGPERFAVRHDTPIYYMKLRMVKRGHYLGELQRISDDPTSTTPGEITEAYVRILEEEIQRDPTPWLWTHRRWKREVPPEVAEQLQHQAYLPPEYER